MHARLKTLVCAEEKGVAHVGIDRKVSLRDLQTCKYKFFVAISIWLLTTSSYFESASERRKPLRSPSLRVAFARTEHVHCARHLYLWRIFNDVFNCRD
jgi:hypothetical protein